MMRILALLLVAQATLSLCQSPKMCSEVTTQQNGTPVEVVVCGTGAVADVLTTLIGTTLCSEVQALRSGTTATELACGSATQCSEITTMHSGTTVTELACGSGSLATILLTVAATITSKTSRQTETAAHIASTTRGTVPQDRRGMVGVTKSPPLDIRPRKVRTHTIHCDKSQYRGGNKGE